MAIPRTSAAQTSGLAEAFSKASDLHKRLLFVLGAFIVFRFGTHVPIAGVDPVALAQHADAMQQGILGMLNMFTGGAFARASVFALNIIPYILASIFVQILTKSIPSMQELEKEGEVGRRKINQYTRYFTVVLAMMNGVMLSKALEMAGTVMVNGVPTSIVIDPGFWFRMHAALTFTAGSMFVVWLSEQINERGIGNGSSLIIFAGIVAQMPTALARTFELAHVGSLQEYMLIGLAILVVGVMAFVVFMESAIRRVLIQYPKRQVGARQSGGESSHMPFKVNLAGVMGPILASQLLLAPTFMLNQFFRGSDNVWAAYVEQYLHPGNLVFNILFVGCIFIFSFWWVALMMEPDKMADRIKKEGGFIPGIRPGAATASYFDYVMTRLMVVGAAYVSFVCVLPQMLIANIGVPFYFGGTSLLIVVAVTMDTMARIQTALIAHRYEGLLKKSRFRKRLEVQ